MKPAMTSAAWIALAVSLGSVPSLAQMQNNTEKHLTCENGGYDSDRARHCEIREQTVPAIGRLTVDANRNGGISIKGALRGDVLVRARVESQADTQSAAAALASQVSIDGSGGQVRATGPDRINNSWWSVSYEIFVPQNTDLTLTTYNGGLTISDVRGQIRFEGHNGGITLKRVAGDVSGSTVNGGIHAELAGSTWDGRQLDLTTHNGGVTVSMPPNYSAHIQAETGNGGVHSDFPVSLPPGNMRPRQLDFHIGGSGPLIHVATTNGGISLKQAQSQ